MTGQQVTDDGVLYGFYGPVVTPRLLPVAGPEHGGTLVSVHGDDTTDFGLGTDYRCAFLAGPDYQNLSVVASYIHPTLIQCPTIAAPVGPVVVNLTLNGQQYQPVGVPRRAGFEFYVPHTVVSLSPSVGAAPGGTPSP